MIEITSFLFMAFFLEGFVNFIKQIVDADKTIKYTYILSLIFGVCLCIIFNLDLLTILGLNSTIPFAGNVVSGLIISRGSNYVNDIYNKFMVKE